MRIDDVHAVETPAPPDVVWRAVESTLARTFGGPRAERAARLLGCTFTRRTGKLPDVGATLPGFRVAASDPPRRLALEGAHRFSTYTLTFEIEPQASGSVVRAVAAAAFPGILGALYRSMLFFAHGPFTRKMLRATARRAERLTRSPTPDTP